MGGKGKNISRAVLTAAFQAWTDQLNSATIQHTSYRKLIPSPSQPSQENSQNATERMQEQQEQWKVVPHLPHHRALLNARCAQLQDTRHHHARQPSQQPEAAAQFHVLASNMSHKLHDHS